MADGGASDRMLTALDELCRLSDQLDVEHAASSLDEATLEVFWRDWPQVSEWATALWSRLNEDLADPAAPAAESDFDETGEGD